MIFAAMLLVSVGAFAQSENTPVKGDVNGDGKVDVADIAAIIAIMKKGNDTTPKNNYYFGETDGYVIMESDFNHYSETPITKIHANHTTGDTVTAFVFPISWGTPTIIDSGGNDATNGWLANTDIAVPAGYRSSWVQIDNLAGETFTITWKK